MAFTKAANSLKSRKSATHEYVNEAYQPFPEEDEDEGYKISGSDENDDVSSVDTESTASNNDSAYQTILKASNDSAPVERQKRKSTKKKLRSSNKWDVFRETSEDNVSSSELDFWNTVFKVTKVIFAIILFILVLGTAVISKSTLFILTSNIFPPNSFRNTSLKTSHFHFRYQTSETAVTYIWSLVLVVIAPYFFTMVGKVWKLIFKKTRPLEFKPLLVALLVETIHSVGLSLFIFVLLPNMDPVAGALFCLNVAILPTLLNLVYSGVNVEVYEETSTERLIRRVLTFGGLGSSLVSLAFWTYYVYKSDSDWQKDKPGLTIFAVLSPIFVSVYWWENFVPQGDLTATGLRKLKRQLSSRRTKISTIVNLWKIVITICMVVVIFGVDCTDGITCLQTIFDVTSNSTLSSASFGHTNLVINVIVGTCSKYLPLFIAAVNIVASFFCYRCCVSANKILAQIPSFSVPLILSTPVTLAFMIGEYSQTELKMTDTCFLPFPRWSGDVEFDWSIIIGSILGYVAIVMVSSYIWRQTKERMQREDRMFVQPMYCGILLDQSMILNRRKYEDDTKGLDEKEKPVELPIPDNLDEWQPGNEEWSPLRNVDTPFIYLCATMWHETENEMTQILKSLFRMDEDQCARRNLQLFFGIRDPDYYEFEAHIFFDDAFDYNGDEATANGYVKQLIRTIDVAISSVHAFGMKIPPPTKIDTPYGGRLIWRLPGGNKMIAHLKDKAKIRHRKRWSQVMYMYYFLAHKLLSLGGGKERIKTIADNTFVLALDGDVDFQPAALKLLVDRMKRNPNVGAACGRIHPIGSGPMVWYQKFEYAVSHWLQKATEHTIGCVLCSPGCFSLFRGSSLMDDNVMRRYTTPPTEARHYVQYDQGEDRWLCTLLLQQGYRVEYCAASDALTYAPEGFYEFYNQRRRWTPSTMANILDLLLDFKNVTKRNNDISMLYIMYQMLLMVSSILTPGTIFLMILGALNMAYPTLSLYWALVINLLPVGIFILLCYLAKGDTQLAYAAVLSTVYSLVMMLVIVGLLKQAADNGFCSVTTVFLCFVAGVFVLAAFIHPQEFWCILHGFLYFLAIPSMSMLLMLYSIGNLHVVSWGTRETPKPATAPKPGEIKKQPEKRGAVQEWLEKLGLAEKAGKSDYMFSFGNLCRCVCCPTETKDTEDIKLRAILDRLDELEARIVDQSESHISAEAESERHVHFSEASDLFEGTRERKESTSNKPPPRHWIHDQDLKEGAIENIRDEETVFWEELIKTYLYPLEGDKKEREKTQAELLELRNTVCLFFLLVNALFVVIVFSLQQVNADSGGSISIELPCADGNFGEAIEPISMAFTAVFGLLLVIQLFCMALHRMSTFLQICSITEIKLSRPKQLQPEERELSVEKGLQLVRDMQGIKDDDTKSVVSDDISISEKSSDSGYTDSVGTLEGQKKRDLWGKIARRRREQQFGTLSQNFVKNFKKLQKHMEDNEMGSTMNVSRGVGNGGLGVVTEGDEENNEVEMRNVKRKFNRFERKSIFTIVQMSRDPRLKQSILQRGNVVTSRWKRAALKAKLRSAAEQVTKNSTDKEVPDGRPRSKVTMLDIARLAVADRDSNVPSEAESEDEVVDQRSRL
ncbi:chitin synthase chs-2-like isoform X2 [Mercenaria mercenaria]|uniref:chitin synthase chs-2-like isoform X2 n=1 Tax=Mercenaria mercenaria TaxID=6596 RepID=UPI00234E7D73|nr:chitin synthase chs-2-like isoform X2 [Mercenaria mercenaria]